MFVLAPRLDYQGHGRYRTNGPTVYAGSSVVITIPGGFTTDLATVPRLFWALLPPTGVYEDAAVVHDWHCVRLAAGDCEISSRDADGLFRRMMREARVPFLTRWLMWTGVRWGALGNRARRGGWWRDAPLVLGISIAVATPVLGVLWWLVQ